MNVLKKIRIQHWIILLGAAAFLMGALIYPLRIYLGHANGVFLESFSAFSHAFFFVLAWGYPYLVIESIIFGGILITVIITWFEYMQDDYYLEFFIDYLPQIIINYARNGAFDQQDVYAGYLGTLMAMIIGIWVTMRKKKLEVKT